VIVPLVSTEGAEPWSAAGHGERAKTGVVVLHGFTGNPNSTRPLGQALARAGYRVEVPCLPGHGTTVRDLARTRYADWYAAAENVVTQVAAGCDHLVVVGLSMGGTIALDLAVRRADVVDAAAVINPLVLAPTQPLARLSPVLQYLLPYVPRDLAGLPTDDIARPSADERAYATVSARAARSLIVELPRIRDGLGRLTRPLLIAHSPRDHSVAPENASALAALVGSEDVRQLVCDRSYHVATLDYDAPRIEAAVLQLLADVGGR
jgi:carboxylesterase